MIEIPELSKTKLSDICKLSQKKWRNKKRLFIAEGEKCVRDLLPEFEAEFVIFSKNNIEKNIDLLHSVNPDICRCASVNEMEKISSLSTVPDVIAVFRMKPELDQMNINLNKTGLYLLLENIQDPGNLGTIVRTSHWMGVNKIFASGGTVDLFNSKTVQATMGSLGKVDVIYTDLVKIIENNPDIPVFGTFLNGEDIYKSTLPPSAMIVMGNEGNGISDELARHIKNRLTIPPAKSDNHPESLNVAIATAMVLTLFRASI